MTHPNSLDLEAFACGEPSAKVGAHVEDCGACAAFVAQLQGLVSAGPSAEEADAAVARAMGDCARTSVRQPSTTKRRLWVTAASVVMPLAAAAAILILARTSPSPGTSTSTGMSTGPGTVDTVQIGVMPSRAEPETQFKGGAQIAVIRERGKEQARFSSVVRVRPGDRLRVEVALDREQAILGGVLADDGSYLELMSQGVRGPGTHFSERSAKIDTLPMRGTILIGSPEAVTRARETRLAGAVAGVTTLRVEWEDGRP